MDIQNKYVPCLNTSDQQYGFKQYLGCNHAIHSVRNVTESFTANRSTVNVYTLDLSKALNRINHYALLIKLMERKLLNQIINFLETYWFNISITCNN